MFKPVDIKVDFAAKEREILSYWEKNKIVEKYLFRNKNSKKRFSFLDGPITANNPMGVHHAWGRTYKDLWQRYFNMKGFAQRFQNGFDCQGLWVEVEVEKDLNLTNKKEIENLVPGDKKKSIAKFVELCKKRVLKYSRIQTEQSKRLGYFMDWNNSYYTMSDENNYMIWHFLKTCHSNGWIYKGVDSVPWCPRCQTAISQHEMLTEDYKELSHETVFIKLPLADRKYPDTYLLIWTTTPWTVPANVAVGVNVKYEYDVWQKIGGTEKLIFIGEDDNGNIPLRSYKGKDITVSEYIFTTAGQKNYKKVSVIKGSDLVGLKYYAPYDDLPRVQQAQKENPVTFHTTVDGSEIVVAGEGTGLLHVAPGAGKEDFDLGKKEKLPVISVIGDDASYLDGMGGFSGKNAKKHPELIINDLKEKEGGRYLLGTFHFLHRYPACWRCKTELVWKVAEEWYIAMDKTPRSGSGKNNNTLREQMKKVAKTIDWHPEFGLERELDWLENLSDWLISKKNRYWGLALPIFECNSCGWFDVIGSHEELKKRAVSGWQEFEGKSPHKPYIDEVKIKCGQCSRSVIRVNDVGNVWLDAGIVPFSTYVDPQTKKLSYTTDKTYWQKWYPADFITESFPGQFKNWFYSMIVMSTVLEQKKPFTTVLGYASVLGEDGRPMHKSWGNAIEFNEGADKIGVDVMRWMFSSQNPEQNILFGYKKADETRRSFHLILWNVYNFFVTYSNIDNFEPPKTGAFSPQQPLDRWILSRLNSVIKEVDKNMLLYKADTASLTIEDFVTDLSQWYVRRSRDRIGPSAADAEDAGYCYRTLFTILLTLSGLIAPFAPFMAESIYRNLTGQISVHLSDWPEAYPTLIDKSLEENMAKVRKIVEKGHAKRKTLGIKVRKPLSELELQADGDFSKVPQSLWQIAADELNVKNLVINKNIRYPIKRVEVSRKQLEAEGQAREIIRKVQLMRKEEGLKLTDNIILNLTGWPEGFTEYIKKETLARKLVKGKKDELVKL
ncbi:isoleucine--tRNA ligase [Candidatus Gottesmanbacteria bacterium RIFCSPHIGHO2_02_FULL_40_24]|nr:MAG: isoleucine--tRNA ligase [Candidatus Gottesmanbacteria bacterium RIFCSPHIGHO2_02_FULL_40_24]